MRLWIDIQAVLMLEQINPSGSTFFCLVTVLQGWSAEMVERQESGIYIPMADG